MSIDIDEVKELIGEIRPLLAGRSPGVVGAVLGDLLATLLASIQGEDRAQLERVRTEVLSQHIELVRELVPLNEEVVFDKMRALARKNLQ